MPRTEEVSSFLDEALVETLYEEHQKKLKSYVRKRLPAADMAQAEDIVQETFTRTIDYLNNGNSVRSPKAFLYTTARNVMTSTVYRRRVHMDTDATDDMDQYAAEATSWSPQQRAAVQQQFDALMIAISSLPDNYREAFVRRRIKGENCREIARAMGIEERTVSTYATRGWQLLEEYFEAHNIQFEKTSEL